MVVAVVILILSVLEAGGPPESRLAQPLNTWVKRSPLEETPPSPRLGYEGACAWDTWHHVAIRYGGHNQGGGGEQGSEVWTFDPLTARWALKEPNTSPPGVCCDQQNVFDPVHGRYVRFPSFSGNHGWQWFREIYLNDSSVWTYDLRTNTWRNMRPLPEPRVSPLRCASWDADHQVIVLFGGEGNHEGTVVYDPYTNHWTRMNPPVEPAFRSGGNMAYDQARRVHVLFGAQFSDDPHTWAYDIRRNEWRDVKPAAMPPTNQNDAVLAYDAAGRVVIALVKITEGEDEKARHRLETWAYDAGANEWKKMKPEREPDPSGNRARVLMSVPEHNVVLLENRTHTPQGSGTDEQQIWTYRFADPKPAAEPCPPAELRVETASNSATLSWKPSPSSGVSGYVIFRGAGERPWEVELRRTAGVGAGETAYRDTGLRRGTVYLYDVRAAAGEVVSQEGAKVRTQPRVVEDIVASVLSPKEVVLAWKGLGERDVAGVHIERALVEVLSEDQLRRLKSRLAPLPAPSVGAVRRIGPFVRITKAPVDGTTFTDTSIDLAKPVKLEGEPIHEHRLAAEHIDSNGKPYRFAVYAYRLRAVNALGVEGGPSPAVFTIPSAPQFLFSKEDGETCRLRWAPNPERGIRGYRVYRLDGRWDSDTVSRLTPDPITTTSHGDPTAGRATRRYHVLAVDAIGQEGFPSSPVWFDREWKRFYVPFTGEWHQ